MSNQTSSSTAQTRSNIKRRRSTSRLVIFALPFTCCLCTFIFLAIACKTPAIGWEPAQQIATTPWTNATWLSVNSTDGSAGVQCHLGTDSTTWSAQDQIIDLVNGTQLEVIGHASAPVNWQNSSNNLYQVKVSQTGQTCYIRMELVVRLDTPVVPTANSTQIAVLRTTSTATSFSPAIAQSSPTPTASPIPTVRQGKVVFEDNDGVNCHTSLDSDTWTTAVIKLSTGDSVTILGDATAPNYWNGSNALYQIKTADGQTCYIRTELITVQP